MCTTRQRIHGFTLIEVIIFIVVVSAGLAGILLVSNTVVKSSAAPMVRKQAIAVAESMLEEILLKEYIKPADSTAVAFGNSGWSRALFDTVDDYNGYKTNGIVDVTGSAVTGLETYNIEVAVAGPASLAGGGSTLLKQVTVNVTWGGGNVVLVGYRGNY